MRFSAIVCLLPASCAPLSAPVDWAHSQQWQSGRITPVGDGVTRVEVHPGDKVGGWSGERAEVRDMLIGGRPAPVTPLSGHEYYAISIKLAPGWQAPTADPTNGAVWGIFLQLHGNDAMPHGTPPALALCAERDFHLNLDSGDVLDGGMRTTPKGVTSYAFADGALNEGQWVQFILDVTWAADDRGALTIYRRNEGEAGWREMLSLRYVATLQFAARQPVLPHYWKSGFYRSGSPFTNLLYLGPVVRAGSFEDAVSEPK